jgi:hypothetical protein
MLTRRRLNQMLLASSVVASGASVIAPGVLAGAREQHKTRFKLAVMTWSFQFKLWKGELKATDVPALVNDMGIDALEWASKTFRNLSAGREVMFQAAPASFYRELRHASDDAGVNNRVMSAGGAFLPRQRGRSKPSQGAGLFYAVGRTRPDSRLRHAASRVVLQRAAWPKSRAGGQKAGHAGLIPTVG